MVLFISLSSFASRRNEFFAFPRVLKNEDRLGEKNLVFYLRTSENCGLKWVREIASENVLSELLEVSRQRGRVHIFVSNFKTHSAIFSVRDFCRTLLKKYEKDGPGICRNNTET